MPDLRLIPRTPLGGAEPRIDRIGAVTITERVDMALASLACRLGRETPFTEAARQLFGLELPAPERVTANGDWTALWTGPQQWLIEAPFATHEDIAAILKTGFGDTASITEQTDGWVRFDLTGPEVWAVLERLTPIDTRKMREDSIRRSVLEHLGCFVIRRAGGFSVLGPRSSARSLHHALAAAARSIA